MDQLIHLVRARRPEDLKAFYLARYWCTKLSSWRGRYRRIFCISFGGVSTQRDDDELVCTNTYSFIGESDIESITLGKTNDEFVIVARADKKVGFGNRVFANGGCLEQTKAVEVYFSIENRFVE